MVESSASSLRNQSLRESSPNQKLRISSMLAELTAIRLLPITTMAQSESGPLESGTDRTFPPPSRARDRQAAWADNILTCSRSMSLIFPAATSRSSSSVGLCLSLCLRLFNCPDHRMAASLGSTHRCLILAALRMEPRRCASQAILDRAPACSATQVDSD
jgi:hypothetical protein